MRISIGKFQELYQISKLDIDELEKSILLVASLTGKEKDEVEKMDVSKFNILCKNLNDKLNLQALIDKEGKPVNYVNVKGKRYFVNYDLSKKPMNSGRYVEIATYSDDIIGNLHKIMATMVTPLKFTWKGFVVDQRKDHKQISEDMLQMDFNVAYHSCIFFYALFLKSIESSITYFTSISDKEIVQSLMKNLAVVMDGYITANWYRNLKI